MWHSATAHAQLLILGGLIIEKIPSCKNFKAKEGMGLFSRGYDRCGYISEANNYCLLCVFVEKGRVSGLSLLADSLLIATTPRAILLCMRLQTSLL